ncbi:MAG: hypothetical protein WC879_08715 [Melioribacteraceae bacterium]
MDETVKAIQNLTKQFNLNLANSNFGEVLTKGVAQLNKNLDVLIKSMQELNETIKNQAQQK